MSHDTLLKFNKLAAIKNQENEEEIDDLIQESLLSVEGIKGFFDNRSGLITDLLK